MYRSGTASHARERETPTVASFAPLHIGTDRSATLFVDNKSSLLASTPPNVIRILSHAYPFISAADRVLALVSWTSGDAYASFLVLAAFWGLVLYSDVLIRYLGPILIALGLIAGMYFRRYSPLSAKRTTEPRLQRSFDDILRTTDLFAKRCNILLEPCLQMTEFLSTQRTPTSSSTRPALTAFFLRVFLLTPLWAFLSLPSVGIITTQRLVLVVGTIALSWRSRPARISRVLLWRSHAIRRICGFLTGLDFYATPLSRSSIKPRRHDLKRNSNLTEALLQSKGGRTAVQFPFPIYENQRHWIGVGWTSTTLPTERGPWTTDREGLEPTVPINKYEPPPVEGGKAVWRWAPSSEWRASPWNYCNNMWKDPQSTVGWDRYTRQRKWVRTAELVELSNESDYESSEGRSDADSGSESDSESVSSSAASTTGGSGRAESEPAAARPATGRGTGIAGGGSASPMKTGLLFQTGVGQKSPGADIARLTASAQEKGLRSRPIPVPLYRPSKFSASQGREIPTPDPRHSIPEQFVMSVD